MTMVTAGIPERIGAKNDMNFEQLRPKPQQTKIAGCIELTALVFLLRQKSTCRNNYCSLVAGNIIEDIHGLKFLVILLEDLQVINCGRNLVFCKVEA